MGTRPMAVILHNMAETKVLHLHLHAVADHSVQHVCGLDKACDMPQSKSMTGQA